MSALSSLPAAVSVPFSADAERSVIGRMLAKPDCIPDVSATLLEGTHFYVAANRVLYDALIEAFFADDPIDPLTIAEGCSKRLARLWDVDEATAVRNVQSVATGSLVAPGNVVDHANVVKRHADLRALLDLSDSIRQAVEAEAVPPDQIAGMASSEAMRIATSSVLKHEIVSFADAGRNFVKEMQRRMALKAQGVTVGAKFAISGIDAYTQGLQPSELLIGGGEAGVGKTSVWTKAAMNFAEAQAQRAAQTGERPVGTLLLSLEMPELPSSTRFGQSLAQIDSSVMRDGSLTQRDLEKIIREWGAKKNYPMWQNYASTLRLSELRAVVSEAVRRHNVGLIILDHFRLLEPDERGLNANEADAERIKFLKNQICKDMDVAMICLAHTRKAIERADKRPRLADLSGSGAIAHFADFVGLMFVPYTYASEKERVEGKWAQTDAEMIWAKNRWGVTSTGHFYFDPSTQSIL